MLGSLSVSDGLLLTALRMPTRGLVSLTSNRCYKTRTDNSPADDPPYVQVQTWLNSTEFAYRMFFEDCAKVVSCRIQVLLLSTHYRPIGWTVLVRIDEERRRESLEHL